MPEFRFQGSVTLRGVTFYVTADSEEEAVARAKAGSHDGYEDDGAETVDWTIRPETVEPNE